MVAYGNKSVFNLHLDEVAGMDSEFVDRVVDGLLQQEVETAPLIGAAMGVADIHTGTFANSLKAFEGDDVFVGVFTDKVVVYCCVV